MRREEPRILFYNISHPKSVKLESDLYQEPNTGIKFGWEVAVTSSPTRVRLVVNNARLPFSVKRTTDALSHVRTHVSGLTFHPSVVGRNESGNLGSGKTTFAQGFLKGLGAKGPFTSPTFSIIKPYTKKI